MKVKIKKKGKTKSYNLIENWGGVTLEKWIELISLDKVSHSKEALGTIKALSNIPEDLIKVLNLQDINNIMSKLSKLQKDQQSELRTIITIDGREYGMHPDLSEITLGEWADLETFISKGVENNMPEIMSVLYRPIIEKSETGNAYIIEAYDGNIDVRAEKFKQMSAEQVQNTLRFFFVLGKRFLEILPSYLMEHKTLKLTEIKEKILQQNGDISE